MNFCVKYPELKKDLKVFVRTITYNQAQYITSALDGVAMQQTDFPFVHFVMDDASTDGEPGVILDWLNDHCNMTDAEYFENSAAKVIFANHKTNVNCHYAIYLLKQNTYRNTAERIRIYQPWRERCQYEALCEGDDYWTNQHKLQKQVDILESRPDVSLCFHPVRRLFPDMTFDDAPYPDNIPVETTSSHLAKSNYIATASVVFRNNSDYINRLATLGKMPFSDYALWILCSQYGKIYCVQDIMAVYRIGSGTWSTMSNFEQYFNSVIGFGKIYSLFKSNEDKEEFDKLIWDYATRVKNEYNYILASKEYKLGNLLLKPLRSIVNAYRILRKKCMY